jgi:hypothetical protein
MCTIHISQIFLLNIGGFFQGHWTHSEIQHLSNQWVFIYLQWARLSRGRMIRLSPPPRISMTNGTQKDWDRETTWWRERGEFIVKNPRILGKTVNKNSIIGTRPTPVLCKIHKMGAPLFSFQPRTPHDPVTPPEKLLSRSNTFFVF